MTNDISFIVADGQSLSEISIKNELGTILNFSQESWEGNDVIVYFGDIINSNESVVNTNDKSTFNVFPNPIKNYLNIEFEISKTENIQIDLFDINGKKASNLFDEKTLKGKHRFQKGISNQTIPKGVYFVVMKNQNGIISRRKVVFI